MPSVRQQCADAHCSRTLRHDERRAGPDLPASQPIIQNGRMLRSSPPGFTAVNDPPPPPGTGPHGRGRHGRGRHGSRAVITVVGAVASTRSAVSRSAAKWSCPPSYYFEVMSRRPSSRSPARSGTDCVKWAGDHSAGRRPRSTAPAHAAVADRALAAVDRGRAHGGGYRRKLRLQRRH